VVGSEPLSSNEVWQRLGYIYDSLSVLGTLLWTIFGDFDNFENQTLYWALEMLEMLENQLTLLTILVEITRIKLHKKNEMFNFFWP
jgi:hypothetical protein